MIRLGMPREPRWIDLPMGVRLKVRPLVTALMQAAKFRAEREYRAAADAWKAAAEAGLADGMAPLDTDDRKAALLFSFTVNEIARECVLDWEGVGNLEGEPIAFTADGLPELMSHNGVAEAFWSAITSAAAAVTAEGNG
jgi:hypothetical protein